MSQPAHFFSPAASTSTLRITHEPAACAAVLFACRRADEIDGPGGTAAFLSILKSRNVFIGVDVEALLEEVNGYFQAVGSPAALIDAAMPAIREQTRMPLFYHCLDVILADGVVTPQEHKIFMYLKAKFGVDEETAFQALDVFLMKNKL